MNTKATAIALYTLIRRELMRMSRIWIQAFLGPITSIFLYFLIFGNVIGQRIGPIHGLAYLNFIAPGLILIAIINTSYAQVSSSLFITRFQKNIEEILITPITYPTILLAYVISAIIRGLLVAIILSGVLTLIFHIPLHWTGFSCLDALLTATIFALIGFSNGLLARDFDEIAFIPSFILTPLSYLAGVFYSLDMLPPLWKTISAYNPLVYMIQIFRAHCLNYHYPLTQLTLTLMCLAIVALFGLNLRLMHRGIILNK